MSKNEKLNKRLCRTEARRLVRDSAFLYRAMKKIGELGVVGERRNRLIVLLAALTKDLDAPVSVIVKGQSSSGKSNLIRKTLTLFPPECVVCRSSLSAKAPAHGEGCLAGKILYLQEYRGGKDAQYLLRLQQSEKLISHEFTTIHGAARGTKVSEREGSPVILTTTTEKKVFTDDETRSLSIWIDDSPGQTLAIMQAQVVTSGILGIEPSLPIWQEAIRIIGRRRTVFRFPVWFSEIAELVPSEHVRVRRDWERFLTFCKVVALCASFTNQKHDPAETVISFADYCVAYRIVNPALASTVYALHEREISLLDAVRTLYKRDKKPITVLEVIQSLKWDKSLVYKYLGPAVQHKLINQIPGTRQSNQKLLEPVPGAESGFLPSPQQVLETINDAGQDPNYLDPLTGKVVDMSI